MPIFIALHQTQFTPFTDNDNESKSATESVFLHMTLYATRSMQIVTTMVAAATTT